MFRILGAFLLVFWLLSIVVRMDAMAEIFGGVSLACFTVGFAFESRVRHRAARQHPRGIASLQGRL